MLIKLYDCINDLNLNVFDCHCSSPLLLPLLCQFYCLLLCPRLSFALSPLPSSLNLQCHFLCLFLISLPSPSPPFSSFSLCILVCLLFYLLSSVLPLSPQTSEADENELKDLLEVLTRMCCNTEVRTFICLLL